MVNEFQKNKKEESLVSQLITQIKKDIQENGTDGTLTNISIKRILKTKKPNLIYTALEELQDIYPIQKLEAFFLSGAYPLWNLKIAHCIKGANLSTNEKAVLKSHDARCNYFYRKEIPNANKNAHALKIIKSKDPETNYLLALEQDERYMKSCEQNVLESKSLEWNFNYMRDVRGANIPAHDQILIDGNKAIYDCYAVMYVPKSNILAHADKVLANGNPRLNYLVALWGHGVNKYAHALAIKESGNELYLREFKNHVGKIYLDNANVYGKTSSMQA